jgi:hypothetical protein
MGATINRKRCTKAPPALLIISLMLLILPAKLSLCKQKNKYYTNLLLCFEILTTILWKNVRYNNKMITFAGIYET